MQLFQKLTIRRESNVKNFAEATSQYPVNINFTNCPNIIEVIPKTSIKMKKIVKTIVKNANIKVTALATPLLVPYIVILVKCSILFIDGISHTGHGITHYNRNTSFIIASSI